MSSELNETKRKIFEATRNLMESGRGQSIRMGDIARAAGISRQALYLHFNSRTELMVETTHYIDRERGMSGRLTAYRTAETAEEILAEFVKFWGNYISEIYGLAKALLAARDTDADAAAAWDDRMNAVRSGCRRVVEAFEKEKKLDSALSREQAVDLLMTILSVQSWEYLTVECGWPIELYVKTMETLAVKALVKR